MTLSRIRRTVTVKHLSVMSFLALIVYEAVAILTIVNTTHTPDQPLHDTVKNDVLAYGGFVALCISVFWVLSLVQLHFNKIDERAAHEKHTFWRDLLTVITVSVVGLLTVFSVVFVPEYLSTNQFQDWAQDRYGISLSSSDISTLQSGDSVTRDNKTLYLESAHGSDGTVLMYTHESQKQELAHS